MTPGGVVLIRLPQVAGGAAKLRPALVLALLPGSYQNVLICGISTQLHDFLPDWDDLIRPGDPDYAGSGLHRASGIRLSYLHAADTREISGAIGRISVERLNRMRSRLGRLLAA